MFFFTCNCTELLTKDETSEFIMSVSLYLEFAANVNFFFPNHLISHSRHNTSFNLRVVKLEEFHVVFIVL